MPPAPSITRSEDGRALILLGDWDVWHARDMRRALAESRPSGNAVIQLSDEAHMDTAGALTLRRWLAQQKDIEPQGALQHHLSQLPETQSTPKAAPRIHTRQRWLAHRANVLDAVIFLGRFCATLGRLLTGRARWRLTSLVRHLEETALNSVPIVTLIALLIAIVLAYQGLIQLQKFGAEIFTIDLVAISILREMGVLLTSVIMAGRSGSAFTAEIGVMKLNDEVDALQTTGLDPYEVLVLPRVIALFIALPLLTFLADVTGLIGSGILSYFLLDISIDQYVSRLQQFVPVGHYWIGLVKAPVFALLIGLISTYHGMQASGSAESVGTHTTKAVVTSIFAVILADAVFSIFFMGMGW